MPAWSLQAAALPALSRMLRANSVLTTLRLEAWEDTFEEDGAMLLLAAALAVNSGLRTLSLCGAGLGGPKGVAALGRALAANSSLESLDLGASVGGTGGLMQMLSLPQASASAGLQSALAGATAPETAVAESVRLSDSGVSHGSLIPRVAAHKGILALHVPESHDVGGHGDLEAAEGLAELPASPFASASGRQAADLARDAHQSAETDPERAGMAAGMAAFLTGLAHNSTLRVLSLQVR